MNCINEFAWVELWIIAGEGMGIRKLINPLIYLAIALSFLTASCVLLPVEPPDFGGTSGGSEGSQNRAAAGFSYLADVQCPSGEGAFRQEVGEEKQVIACGKLHKKLSETVYEVGGVHVFYVDHKSQKTELLLQIEADEKREVLVDRDARKVLVFEDIVTEKKLPLFSQEISCNESGCIKGEKVCLFKKDKAAHIESLQAQKDLRPLMNDRDGQVKVLLAALSGYKPAIQAYSQRSPQSQLPKKAQQSYKLHKRQLLQALEACK